ncbi:hypothetical protein HKD37_10G027668 [Glycine soja]
MGLGVSPYEIAFGKKPLSLPQYIIGTSKIDVVDEFLSNRKKLEKAQANMKHFVMIKLRPHTQSSTSGVSTSYSKLVKRFYEPYQVLDQIGKVAYKLLLPERSRIHPAFHCSFLKPFHQTSEEDCVPLALPSNDVENQPVLVQWAGLSLDDITWEDWEELKTVYHLVDKVFLDGARDDRKENTIGLNGRPKRQIRPPRHLKDFI